MALQILGGMAQGFKIEVPKGDKIRPMAIRLKRRLFDAYQNMSPYIFVDLCAGSGAVGLEAWSRGAQRVYFNEKDKKVYKLTSDNIKRFKQQNSQETQKREIFFELNDCMKFMEKFKSVYNGFSEQEKKYTCLFFAPPYPQHSLYSEMIDYLKKSKWYIGDIWIESDRQKGISEENIEELFFTPYKVYRQGTTFLGLYDCGLYFRGK